METRKLCSFKLPESSRGKLDRLAAGLGVSKTEVIVLALAGMDLPDNRFKKEGPDRDIAKAILADCTAPAGVLAASYAIDAHTKLNAVLEPTADGSAFVVRELDPPKTFAELKAEPHPLGWNQIQGFPKRTGLGGKAENPPPMELK